MAPSIAMYQKKLNWTSIIYLHTVRWSNSSISNNWIQHKSFVFTQFKCPTVLFDSLIEPYQALSLWVRVDLRVIAMKVYCTFPKAPTLLESHHQIVWYHILKIRKNDMLQAGIETLMNLCQSNILPLSYRHSQPKKFFMYIFTQSDQFKSFTFTWMSQPTILHSSVQPTGRSIYIVIYVYIYNLWLKTA